MQWSTGGWFGSLFGGTLWMAVCALWIAREDPLLSAGLFGLFLLAVGIGVGFFNKRGSLAPLRAIQWNMLSLMTIGCTFIVCADRAGAWGQVTRTWVPSIEVSAWLFLAIYLGICLWLLVFLTFLDRANRPRPAG
jgi:hypothetical protein